jgi:hypothetical protein
LSGVAATQSTHGSAVPEGSEQAGDLVCYTNGGVHHIGIVTGPGAMVSAEQPSTGIRDSNIWPEPHIYRRIFTADTAAAATGTVTAGGASDEATWAKQLLTALGKPVTPTNLSAITAWAKAEGGNWHNTAKFNPLNTTQNATGATSMNSVGVKSYTSWQQGMQATVDTLNNGRYGGILAALSTGTSDQAVRAAVARSPWGTGAF